MQGANQSDFSDAVVLLECKHVVPGNWLTGSTYWFDVPAHTFATPQTFRYIRFIQPTDNGEGTTSCGNVTEVEFYGMDADALAAGVLADPQPPTDLTASRGDYPTVGTFLKWQIPAGVSNSVVMRAPSEIQLYGWTESDIAGLAAGIEDLSATCGTTPSVTLAWTSVQFGTYTIERKTDDGAWTTVASALPAATATWTDTNVVCDGTRYTAVRCYRWRFSEVECHTPCGFVMVVR